LSEHDQTSGHPHHPTHSPYPQNYGPPQTPPPYGYGPQFPPPPNYPPTYHAQSPYPPPGRPPKRRSTTGKVVLRLVGGLVLLMLIAAAVNAGRGSENHSTAAGGGSTSQTLTDRGTTGPGTNTGSKPASADTGPDFPGKKPKDVAVAAGGTVAFDGLQVTSTELRRGSSTFGKTLCTTVTYVNGSNRTASYNTFDFEMQDAKGAIVNPTFFGGGDTIGSGDLAPGGTVSGDVCFEDKAASNGLYIVFYKSSFWRSDRAAFLNQR
jgi:U5 snRNP spliceosome subunit